MKLTHKLNFGWSPPTPDVVDEKGVEKALRKAAKAWRKSQQALERAERVAVQRPSPDALAAVRSARDVVLERLAELREIEALMQQAPTSGAHWSGRGSVRNPLPRGSKL